MNKREICEKNRSFAYISALGGVELKEFEYGINDYVYCVSNAWHGKKRYHKVRINYGLEDSYIIIHGYRLKLSEAIKMHIGPEDYLDQTGAQ